MLILRLFKTEIENVFEALALTPISCLKKCLFNRPIPFDVRDGFSDRFQKIMIKAHLNASNREDTNYFKRPMRKKSSRTGKN